MRITTWNINGLRTLRQYRPWYALKDWKACLDYLEADIICFQEVKLTRKALVANHRDMCLPEGYEAYYSLHPTKGYSGVATFVKKDACQVSKAEMGLTGELVPQRNDTRQCIGGYPDERAPDCPVYDQIDAEGRAVVVDCGLFVLFNLYCPNETDEGRREYKMAYYHTLAERVQNLLLKGREVIIVGDLNIAHLPIDHCEGVNKRTRQEHLDIHPARQWLEQFLTPNGDFHDVTRRFHPTRKFMYTCWDTVKDTRPANYGVRIDYTFVSRGLLPWIKDADIQPNIYGSDHCPVFVDLHEQIQDAHGQTLYLRDKLMGTARHDEKRKSPALATTNWPEFAGRRIQSFFAPKNSSNSAASRPDITPSPSPIEANSDRRGSAQSPPNTHAVPSSSNEIAPEKKLPSKQSAPPKPIAKPKISPQIKSPGQSSLRSFFQKPVKLDTPPESRTSDAVMDTVQRDDRNAELPLAPDLAGESKVSQDISAEQTDVQDTSSAADRVASAMAWGSIFAPRAPPTCTLHREPARAWTVNKPGPNHGRKFWMCARPVGSGGTGNAKDDLPFRCSYWKWDSDVRAQQPRLDRQADGSARFFGEVAGRAPRLGSGEKRGYEQETKRAPHKSVSSSNNHKRQKSNQSP